MQCRLQGVSDTLTLTGHPAVRENASTTQHRAQSAQLQTTTARCKSLTSIHAVQLRRKDEDEE